MVANIPSRRGFFLKWIFACGIGELLGIGVAAGIGFSFFLAVGEPDTTVEKILTLLLAICAGIIEGLVTGSLQWVVLRRSIDVKARNWLFYTALGAALCWLMGMTYPTFFIPEASASSQATAEPSSMMIAVLAAASGIVLGAIFGAFQWIELKRHTDNTGWWILANLLGWMVGLALIYLGASVPTADTSMTMVILIGTVSGLLAGLSVGAITGAFLIWRIAPGYQNLIVLD